jgi:hypothetical protein
MLYWSYWFNLVIFTILEEPTNLDFSRLNCHRSSVPWQISDPYVTQFEHFSVTQLWRNKHGDVNKANRLAYLSSSFVCMYICFSIRCHYISTEFIYGRLLQILSKDLIISDVHGIFMLLCHRMLWCHFNACTPKTDFLSCLVIIDRLCGLVVRVPGYRSIGPGFDYRRYQIFWGVVGLERGPLSLVSTIQELLGRNSSGSGLENREYGRGDPLRWPRDTLYPQKLALHRQAVVARSV